jgi:hypothetical protein
MNAKLNLGENTRTLFFLLAVRSADTNSQNGKWEHVEPSTEMIGDTKPSTADTRSGLACEVHLTRVPEPHLPAFLGSCVCIPLYKDSHIGRP